MFLGCFVLNRELTRIYPDRFDWVLGLLGVLNLYELQVVGLGLFLAGKKHLLRDAGYLLVLEVILMSDLTLLYNRCFTMSLSAGFVVCAVA